MKNRYIKNFENFNVNEEGDTVKKEDKRKENPSNSTEKVSSDFGKENSAESNPPVDELEEKGLTNKSNLSH